VGGIAGFPSNISPVGCAIQHAVVEQRLDLNHHVDGGVLCQLRLAGRSHGIQKTHHPFHCNQPAIIYLVVFF
jgi:hypothetical protein